MKKRKLTHLQITSLGGKASAAAKTKKQRVAQAKKAADARWGNR